MLIPYFSHQYFKCPATMMRLLQQCLSGAPVLEHAGASAARFGRFGFGFRVSHKGARRWFVTLWRAA
jgi:hypothetical protein